MRTMHFDFFSMSGLRCQHGKLNRKAVFLRAPLLMNFLTLTTTFTFASPSDERGLSIISMAGWMVLRKFGALAEL
jgi:hypothetical protein